MAVFTEPFRSHLRSVCRRAILLKYEVIIHTSCAGGCHNMPRPCDELGPFDLESGVRVTCDVG